MAAAHIGQNVETIAAVQARDEEAISHHQRLIERVTGLVARPRTIYGILVACAFWVGTNLALRHWGLAEPDPPPFFWFQGCISLAALMVAMMVLTTQNRLARQAEIRAQLDLQVNLLAEQKIAKLIALVEELRRDMPAVRDREDPIATAMSRAVDPHAVVSALDDTVKKRNATESKSDVPLPQGEMAKR